MENYLLWFSLRSPSFPSCKVFNVFLYTFQTFLNCVFLHSINLLAFNTVGFISYYYLLTFSITFLVGLFAHRLFFNISLYYINSCLIVVIPLVFPSAAVAKLLVFPTGVMIGSPAYKLDTSLFPG